VDNRDETSGRIDPCLAYITLCELCFDQKKEILVHWNLDLINQKSLIHCMNQAFLLKFNAGIPPRE